MSGHHNFQDIVSIGFDKNGEADFRICMAIAGFDRKRMDELRRMGWLAIAQAEKLWHEQGPPSKEMAAQTSIMTPPEVA